MTVEVSGMRLNRDLGMTKDKKMKPLVQMKTRLERRAEKFKVIESEEEEDEDVVFERERAERKWKYQEELRKEEEEFQKKKKEEF
mmetsp:Transcript_35696/g.26509  ORF Transcript_35696/g.26509 Transcript_35696/m.26509 type:complete len:85 (+) Transcript_35696:242-496(+)